MGKHHSRHIDHEACIAYYRNALSPQRALRIRTYLEAHPHEARRARIDADNERAIAQSLDGVLQEPVPTRLRFKTQPATNPWPGRLALVATIVVSVASGWWLGGMPVAIDSNTAFTERVVSAAQQPVPRSMMQTVAHAPIEISPPDLSLQGYRLVQQQRLDSAEPALVEFVYRNASGRQLRIYAETGFEHHTMPPVTSHDGISLVQWREGDTRYALVGDMPEMSLQTLAQAVRTGSAGGGTNLAGTGQWRATQLDDGNRSITMQQSPLVVDDVIPDAVNDDYTVQPARM